MLPSRNGQTRPLVVDSLQLISIYSIYSLILSPRSDHRDAETIVISSYKSVGGRDGVGKLANVTSNLSCLSILFQFRHQCFHGQIIQPLTHILMYIFFILPY